MTACLNCNGNFGGAFCNFCGQKAATHRFTMHEWLHEVPHSILHVDSGFILTMKTLFLRPGDAVREFLQGKRKLLFSPFLYVLILCGVYVVVTHFFGNSAKEVKEFTNLQEAFAYIEEHYYKIIVALMIFPMTIGTYFAYFKSGYNFAEHLVLNAYLIGQLVFADVILILIATTGFKENHSAWFNFIEFILKYPFWFWMYWQFFKPLKWYWGILQFIISNIITGIALYILMTIAAFILLRSSGLH
ncbi:MAG: DUF3667 domain-containing protein [Pyrinomonadaceae bacterium]